MAVIMRDALKPNLMQTLENTPVLVHAGPFGNIAHGNSSVVADLIGIHAGDFLITEAGFGADMGAERFFNIKCRASGLTPDAAVVVATVRALKAHSGKHKIVAGKPLPEALLAENPDEVHIGGANLRKQIENIRLHGVTPVVAINAFPERPPVRARGDPRDRRRDGRAGRGLHALRRRRARARAELAEAVAEAAEEPSDFQLLYPDEAPLREKIETVAHAGLRRRRRRLHPGRRPAARRPTSATASATCRSASPRRTCRSRRTRRSRVRRPAGGCRCARCAPRSAPGSSTRSAATCARCRAWARTPAAYQIDIDDDGNVVGLF